MAISLNDFKRLEREVETLRKKVARLERRENGTRRTVVRKRKLSGRERVRDALRRGGLLAELTPEEKAMAAEWRALPDEEKQRVRDELWNLKLEKPISQIIIENR